jgi:hypothetical protein
MSFDRLFFYRADYPQPKFPPDVYFVGFKKPNLSLKCVCLRESAAGYFHGLVLMEKIEKASCLAKSASEAEEATLF